MQDMAFLLILVAVCNLVMGVLVLRAIGRVERSFASIDRRFNQQSNGRSTVGDRTKNRTMWDAQEK